MASVNPRADFPTSNPEASKRVKARVAGVVQANLVTRSSESSFRARPINMTGGVTQSRPMQVRKFMDYSHIRPCHLSGPKPPRLI